MDSRVTTIGTGGQCADSTDTRTREEYEPMSDLTATNNEDEYQEQREGFDEEGYPKYPYERRPSVHVL